MSHKLVSIVTPCYNADKYIHNLLDSVLSQSYPSIEMFVIDDGSTDNSAKIIEDYVSKFSNKGYTLKYVYQENQGQSVAINNGLKLISGEYLVWPDADDYYADSTAITKMVEALVQSDDTTSMVRVQINVLNETGEILNQVGVTMESRFKTDLFEDCLFKYGNGFWGVAGSYMAKVAILDSRIPHREIYTEKDAGQNWQLCLPLLYEKKCVTIEEYLYNIVAHEDSHSRNVATNSDRQKIYYRTIKSTLGSISLSRDYRDYLLKRTKELTLDNIYVEAPRRPYRTYAKKVAKGILPYGLMMLYKRRQH